MSAMSNLDQLAQEYGLQGERHPLADAVKCPRSIGGSQAFLQWEFTGSNLPRRSVQMPEDVIDAILRDRDTVIDALKLLRRP